MTPLNAMEHEWWMLPITPSTHIHTTHANVHHTHAHTHTHIVTLIYKDLYIYIYIYITFYISVTVTVFDKKNQMCQNTLFNK